MCFAYFCPNLASMRRFDRWDFWQPGLGVVDVTNPDARKWYTDKLNALIDLGVDTFKVCYPPPF